MKKIEIPFWLGDNEVKPSTYNFIHLIIGRIPHRLAFGCYSPVFITQYSQCPSSSYHDARWVRVGTGIVLGRNYVLGG